ncbi:MAG: methionyl-tRNA formyltransferase [Ardenticatenaceae bacterium]|nr:methionyl-tRNA formyltransferase [Ardenticatenaceae bacterium]
MARIVFMGTPDFAVPALERLIATGRVVGVVTQPDRPAGRGNTLRQPPVKKTALAAGLPIYQPRSLKKEAAVQPIREWDPELIVVAAFGQILRPHLLDLPRLGCINIHASLLPRWRGAAPIQAVILAGDRETGITLMQMDEGLDTGPMLVKEKIAVAADETAASLHDRLAILGGEMIDRHLDDLIAQRLTPVTQNQDEATYARMIRKEDGLLDWQQPAVELERRVRAMTPWPGAFSFWGDKQLKIHAADVLKGSVSLVDTAVPGQVIAANEIILIATGDGYLHLLTCQLQGKKRMSAADFVRGRPEFVGSILGNF